MLINIEINSYLMFFNKMDIYWNLFIVVRLGVIFYKIFSIYEEIIIVYLYKGD